MNKRLAGLIVLALITLAAVLTWKFYNDPQLVNEKQNLAIISGKVDAGNFDYRIEEINLAVKVRQAEYKNYLESLDKREIDSVRLGVRCYINSFKSSPLATRDKAFKDFFEFYINYVANASYKYQIFPSKEEPDQKVELHCRKNGMLFDFSEGEAILVEDPYFLYKIFTPYVSKTMKEFIRLHKEEVAGGLWGDGSLIISFAEVGNRLRDWEAFYFQYPNFILANETKNNYEKYLILFLRGHEPSIFTASPYKYEMRLEVLEAEVKNAYEKYIGLNINLPSGRLVKEFYDILKEHDFKYENYVEEFYLKNKIRTIHELWESEQQQN